MWGKWINYREIISYLFWGVMTTLVNWISYALLIKIYKTDATINMISYVFKINVFAANILSWFFAVVFAFVTNKLFVFRSKSWRNAVFVPELWKFFSARIVTGVIEIVAVPVLVWVGLNQQIFGIEGSLAKGIVTVIVIILNYVFSKLLVFRTRHRDI